MSYEIVSNSRGKQITAFIELPSRVPSKVVFLRLRHPNAATIKNVEVEGTSWNNFDRDKQLIRLEGLKDRITVQTNY